MQKTIALLALFALAGLGACSNGGSVNANCATMGAVGGAALGAATHNNVAQSAIAGGIIGAIAGDRGACR